MQKFAKIPLYLGLGVFVISVLVSAVTIGQRTTLGIIGSKALQDSAELSLRYTSPDTISLELVSKRQVDGVDVRLSYDKNKVLILPSTLTGLSSFITTGGNLDEGGGTFSFSVIAQEDSFSTGVIAMFKIKPTESVIASGDKLITTQLSFITGDGGSAVLERETGANILQKSEAIKFDLVAE